jgi:hypothetical protein
MVRSQGCRALLKKWEIKKLMLQPCAFICRKRESRRRRRHTTGICT